MSIIRYPFVVHLLFAGVFLVGWAEMSIVGLLDLIAQDFTTVIGRVSVVVTLYSLSFAILAPLIVIATRKFGLRLVLTGMMAIMALANLICATSTSVIGLAASRIVLAAAAGAFAGTTLAAVATLVPSSLSGRALGYILVGFGGALVLGIPGSVFVADLMGWRAPFFVIAAVSAILCLLLASALPTGSKNKSESKGEAASFFSSMCSLPSSAHLCQTITFFWMVGYSIIFTYLAKILVVDANLELRNVSAVLLVFGIACLVGAHIGGGLTDRIGALPTATISLILHSVILISAPLFLSSFWGACSFVLFWGVVSWMSTPPVQSFIARESGSVSDVMLSLNNSVLHVGIACGAWIGALMLDAERTMLYATAAVSVAAAAVISMLIHRMIGQTQPRTSPD